LFGNHPHYPAEDPTYTSPFFVSVVWLISIRLG
jgi:hypothetical protein